MYGGLKIGDTAMLRERYGGASPGTIMRVTRLLDAGIVGCVDKYNKGFSMYYWRLVPINLNTKLEKLIYNYNIPEEEI